MNPAKSFAIHRRQVWEAYKRVKVNQGGAGTDAQTLEDFAQDLGNNLYKLWNRMSSGSYHPPPVKRVEIPKADGGIRPLGIPTVVDRIAQTVVKQVLEPELEKHNGNRKSRSGVCHSNARAVRNCQQNMPCSIACWLHYAQRLNIRFVLSKDNLVIPKSVTEDCSRMHNSSTCCLPWLIFTMSVRCGCQPRDNSVQYP